MSLNLVGKLARMPPRIPMKRGVPMCGKLKALSGRCLSTFLELRKLFFFFFSSQPKPQTAVCWFTIYTALHGCSSKKPAFEFYRNYRAEQLSSGSVHLIGYNCRLINEVQARLIILPDVLVEIGIPGPEVSLINPGISNDLQYFSSLF